MKKMTSFLALVLALSIPSGAYAAEAKLDDNNTTANGNVYAVYTEDVSWTVCLLTTMEMLLLIFQMAQA